MKAVRIFILIITAVLCGCVYHHPFQQGNVITPNKVQKIHAGMSSTQVVAALGSPVLKNVYTDGRMNYIYTSQPTRDKIIIKKLLIDFRNDRVVNIRTEL